jgi:3-oxoacyl-[acyl-carrier protein] reductase
MGSLHNDLGVMIILTGVTGGIGTELIKELTGVDSIIGISRSATSLKSDDDRVRFVNIDLESSVEIESFANAVGQKASNIIIIHAAAFKKDALTVNCEEEDWERAMRVNLTANFLLSKAFIPHMIKQKWGRIIHFSSLGGISGRPGTIAYSTSKSGLLGLSKVLSKEYGRFNITSNVLVLGHFETGLYDDLQEDEKQRLLESIPSKKLGSVADIAKAIKFVIGSDYVNGAEINIDGGAAKI